MFKGKRVAAEVVRSESRGVCRGGDERIALDRVSAIRLLNQSSVIGSDMVLKVQKVDNVES